MLLSYHELHELIESGVIDADPENVNGTSIDMRLDRTILVELEKNKIGIVDPSLKQTQDTIIIEMPDSGYLMMPGQCVLASTVETFNLPLDISCQVKLKSSSGRVFLNHMMAGWGDPGWHNSKMTLELKNDLQYNAVLIKPNMKICQVSFWRSVPVPEDRSYKVRGRYNNTTTVTESKGLCHE
jgi:dCTP deaminase